MRNPLAIGLLITLALAGGETQAESMRAENQVAASAHLDFKLADGHLQVTVCWP